MDMHYFDLIPAWIFFKDKENKFIRVNKAFCDVMKMSKEQLEGKSLFDIYPKEEAEAYWKVDKEVISSGKPIRNIVEPMETKDGRLWVQTDKIPYHNSKDEITGVVGFSFDITPLKKAEAELKQLHAEEIRKNKEMEKLLKQLQEASAEIKKLKSILPICSYCKSIRDENGDWEKLETYIAMHTNSNFSHGICPKCLKKNFPEYAKEQE